MADFISALTGVQMDQALMDMAEHNSEAYAVGERNGIAVASDDVTYHNNARYYAQIASSQIVGDASSAVRWDTDQSEALTDAQKAQARENINAASDSDVVKITAQTLTSAQQSQARANIMAGGSNPNLLDNPFFTVRQRGSGAFTSGYTVDRWKISGGNPTITPLTGYGVTLSQTTNTAFEQLIDPALMSFCNGKTLTLSVYTSAGIFTGTGTLNTSVSAYSIRFLLGTTGFRAGLYNSGTSYWFARIDNPSAGTYSVDIYAMKLELGSVSTLVNDTPPNYAEELAKCQRYFFRINGGYHPFGVGDAVSTTAIRIFVPTPVPMRVLSAANVTVTMNGGVTMRPHGSGGVSATAVACDSINSNGVGLSFTIGTAITQYSIVLGVLAGSNNPIDISCDL